MKVFNLSSKLHLIANFLEKTNPYTSNKNRKEVNWFTKRIILHLIWGSVNILGLIYFSTMIIGSGWEFIIVICGFIYCSAYWLITSILFDKLIGDEIDNALKQS
ncbi:MAG: hypothetical protein WA839_05885 [Flavobacteriaceae bacterium]